MKALTRSRIWLSLTISNVMTSVALAQSQVPYVEGPAWEIQMIKAKYGFEDNYFENLRATLKPALDEAKKQKVILDYKIFFGEAASSHDYNVLILLKFQNMAAFDNLRDRLDPILVKAAGSVHQQTEIQVKRLDLREVIGEKIMREIMLK